MAKLQSAPEVRRLAKQLGVDLLKVAPTGWSPFWKVPVVTKQDLLQYAERFKSEVKKGEAA